MKLIHISATKRNLAVGLGSAAAALVLGVAAAGWGSSVTQQNQQINSGSPALIDLYASGVTGSGTPVLTETAVSNFGPTQTTGLESASVQNDGNTSASVTAIAVTQTPSDVGGTGLAAELQACIVSNAEGTNTILYNGPISGATAVPFYNSLGEQVTVPLAPAASFTVGIEIYAGPVTETCGSNPAKVPVGVPGPSSAAPLDTSAANGQDVVDLTMSWTGS